MKKYVLFMLTMVGTLTLRGQIIDIDYSDSRQEIAQENRKVEFLKNGFLDFLSNGNVQASARLLKLNIGEPGGFYIPFYVYTGAAGNTFGENKLNETTVSNLLNPIGGTINASFNGLANLWSFGEGSITKLRFAYQAGLRNVNGTDSLTGKNMNFFNGLGNVGLFFQTGAWKDTDTDNMGVFYVQAKATASLSSKGNLQALFGPGIDDGLLMGYSLDAGIEIDKVINLKASVYQYMNHTDVNLLREPVVKFSIDYSFTRD